MLLHLNSSIKKISVLSVEISSIFLVLYSATIFAIGGSVKDHIDAYTIPENCNFEAVAGQFISNPCSPKIIDRKFRGIVINSPKEIFYTPGNQEPFGGFAFIPICGAFKEANGEPPEGGVMNSLVLVAVDTISKRVYSGKYVEPGVPAQEPQSLSKSTGIPSGDEPGWLTGGDSSISRRPGSVISGGYFNFNLTEVVLLPEKAAEYIVYVTAGPIKSNVRTIKIIQKK